VPRVAVVGSYGVGLTMRVPRMPVAGETLSGGEFSSGHGGKGSNQAVQAARLGAQVDFFTAIGADDLGRGGQVLWAEEGINASVVVPEDAATMAGVILVEESGENRIVIAPGALARLRPEDLDDFESALAAADIVVVSLEIPVEVAVRALELAHAAGTRTLLNPAPAAPMPDSVWPAVGVLTPNATEAAVLLGLDPDAGAHSAESLALRLHERTGATIMMTRGGHGVLVCLDGEITHVPPVEAAAVVDTTGAGDSFTGAAAVALAEGADPMTAAQFGARAGAWTVAHSEVIPALPRRSDLDSSSISSSPTTSTDPESSTSGDPT